jgi:tetratricopeptide (TPR) repeat protein
MSTTSSMRAGTSGSRRWLAAIGIPLFLMPAILVPAAAPDQQGLDRMLAAYASGDHEVVTRTLARSRDFQKHDLLLNERHLEKWLGAWDRTKAAMLAEIVDRASIIALAYGRVVLAVGQRYVLNRPSPPGASPADDAIERRWHLIAVGSLQRRSLADPTGRYLEALQARRHLPESAAVWDPRLDLGGAIGQEQRCRLLHATARHDRVLAELEGAAATPTAERQAAIECVRAALSLFEKAAVNADTRDEALTRAGFALLQLGRNEEAQKAPEDANPGADRTLAYWRALFRGRVADALGADMDSERAYREALANFPDAHSASVGLALALFRLRRDDDAEAAAGAVRKRSITAVDPWDSYLAGEARFVERWIGEMRGALK